MYATRSMPLPAFAFFNSGTRGYYPGPGTGGGYAVQVDIRIPW